MVFVNIEHIILQILQNIHLNTVSICIYELKAGCEGKRRGRGRPKKIGKAYAK